MKKVDHIQKSDAPIIQRMATCQDREVSRAFNLWSNPDRVMDSKLDLTSVIDAGIAKFKTLD